MGSRLESNREQVEKASEIENKGLENAEKDAQEISEFAQVIEGMDKDVDEDILEAMEETENAARSEGAEHMESEVHGEIEDGYEIANDAISEANEQTAKSNEIASEFSSLSDITEFGSSTAEVSAENAENIGEQFNENAETAQEQMDDTEDRYQNFLEDIVG